VSATPCGTLPPPVRPSGFEQADHTQRGRLPHAAPDSSRRPARRDGRSRPPGSVRQGAGHRVPCEERYYERQQDEGGEDEQDHEPVLPNLHHQSGWFRPVKNSASTGTNTSGGTTCSWPSRTQVLPVRQGVRNLPADVNRPRGARPANEDEGLDAHAACKLGRHRPAGAVARDLRIVGECGRHRLQLRPPGADQPRL
jgi:hypothetical protein